jgi:hypothetical protein
VVREHLEGAVVEVVAEILKVEVVFGLLSTVDFVPHGERDGVAGCDGQATDRAATLEPRWDMELLTPMTTWIGRWREAHPVLWRWLAWPLRSGCDWHCHRLRYGGGDACANRVRWTVRPIRIRGVLCLAIMTSFAGSVLMATAAFAVDDSLTPNATAAVRVDMAIAALLAKVEQQTSDGSIIAPYDDNAQKT